MTIHILIVTVLYIKDLQHYTSDKIHFKITMKFDFIEKSDILCGTSCRSLQLDPLSIRRGSTDGRPKPPGSPRPVGSPRTPLKSPRVFESRSFSGSLPNL